MLELPMLELPMLLTPGLPTLELPTPALPMLPMLELPTPGLPTPALPKLELPTTGLGPTGLPTRYCTLELPTRYRTHPRRRSVGPRPRPSTRVSARAARPWRAPCLSVSSRDRVSRTTVVDWTSISCSHCEVDRRR
jgi:hypothetical protein